MFLENLDPFWVIFLPIVGIVALAVLRVKLKEARTKTIADKIRSMSDEELAAYWADQYDNFCQNKPECGTLLDADECIPEERCVACALEWLRKPAEEG